MILRQFLHDDPVAASYLPGCGGRAAGAVVDPVDDIAPFLAAAEATGLQIRYVVDTHLHADHLSPGRRLADAAGGEYVVHADADAQFPFKGVRGGDMLDLGNVAMTVLHTPGHTPEHVSLVVTDRTRSAEPWFVLTGHTLMVGDLGRTELASSIEDGARALLRSAAALKALPDHLEILPGAYSRSVCGRGLSGNPTQLQKSRFSTLSALAWMNSRRGSTTSPMSLVNRSSASAMSSTRTCSSVRASGSRVVSHN